MHQDSIRLPKSGEVWRHYKGQLYVIVGLARNDEGEVYVVYCEDMVGREVPPMLYTQSVSRFLQSIDGHAVRHVPRFSFSHPLRSSCAFLHPALTDGARSDPSSESKAVEHPPAPRRALDDESPF